MSYPHPVSLLLKKGSKEKDVKKRKPSQRLLGDAQISDKI